MKHLTAIDQTTLDRLKKLEGDCQNTLTTFRTSSPKIQHYRLIRQCQGNLDARFSLPQRLRLRRRDILTSEAGRALSFRMLETVNFSLINHFSDPLYRDALVATAENCLIRETSRNLIVQVLRSEWRQMVNRQIRHFGKIADRSGIDTVVQGQRMDLLADYFTSGQQVYVDRDMTYVQFTLKKKYMGEISPV